MDSLSFRSTVLFLSTTVLSQIIHLSVKRYRLLLYLDRIPKFSAFHSLILIFNILPIFSFSIRIISPGREASQRLPESHWGLQQAQENEWSAQELDWIRDTIRKCNIFFILHNSGLSDPFSNLYSKSPWRKRMSESCKRTANSIWKS